MTILVTILVLHHSGRTGVETGSGDLRFSGLLLACLRGAEIGSLKGRSSTTSITGAMAKDILRLLAIHSASIHSHSHSLTVLSLSHSLSPSLSLSRPLAEELLSIWL